MKVNAEVDSLLNKIVKDLEDVKAKDIQIINIKNRSALGDYMIIVSGTSSRHINSIVSNIVKLNKTHILSTEGVNSTDWLIVDFGDIILNVFIPETREHYSLEKIWKNHDLEDEKFRFG
jgi:ribosome-associated protein